jgi:hypothetical protein
MHQDYIFDGIVPRGYNEEVKWEVEFHSDFGPEFDALPEEVQDEVLSHSVLLEQFGPSTRPASGRYAERLPSRQHEGVAV